MEVIIVRVLHKVDKAINRAVGVVKEMVVKGEIVGNQEEI